MVVLWTPEGAATSSTRRAVYPARRSSSAVALTTRGTTCAALPRARRFVVLLARSDTYDMLPFGARSVPSPYPRAVRAQAQERRDEPSYWYWGLGIGPAFSLAGWGPSVETETQVEVSKVVRLGRCNGGARFRGRKLVDRLCRRCRRGSRRACQQEHKRGPTIHGFRLPGIRSVGEIVASPELHLNAVF